MSLAETQSEYDDVLARRHLARAVSAHQMKCAELSEMRESVKEAEARLTGMKERIDQSADAEDAVEELAANALRSGQGVSERSPAMRAKEQRDQLIGEYSLLTRGLERLRARASGLEQQVAAEYAEVARCRELLIQHMLEVMATELAALEERAAATRSRLYGFSTCGTGSMPLALLRSPPKNSVPPQLNSPAQVEVDRQKRAFQSWKRALESDPNAQLNL